MGDINMLMKRLSECWNAPVEVVKTADLVVIVKIELNRDGSLARPPVVTNSNPNPVFSKAAESAVRAVRRCAPFSFLPAAKYEAWKSIEVSFDPRILFH